MQNHLYQTNSKRKKNIDSPKWSEGVNTVSLQMCVEVYGETCPTGDYQINFNQHCSVLL